MAPPDRGLWFLPVLWIFIRHCAVVNSQSGAVRLVSVNKTNEGLLEHNVNGSWTPVCGDGFNTSSASVVCRELGFPPDQAAYHFDNTTVTSSNRSYLCNGNEQRLSNCSTVLSDQCSQNTGVYIQCQDAIRLAEGLEPHEGRLEVYRDGDWYVVCSLDFNQEEANVVCRNLGFPTSVARYNPSGTWYPRNTDPEYRYDCVGNEATLRECTSTTWTCSQAYIVNVICDNGIAPTTSTRLVGGSSEYEGRLQVFQFGAWFTVCDRYWSQVNSDVACQSVFGDGYKGSFVSRNKRPSFYGTQSTGAMLFEEVVCSGEESSILNCSRVPPGSSFNCTHNNDAAVTCREDTVHLVNGSVDGWGELQYWSGGQWSAVCAQGWNTEDTAVVCTHLGYPPDGAKVLNVSSVYNVYNQSFNCTGDEKSLSDCPTSALGNCSDNWSVFIKCPGKVRLADGLSPNEGRLEMYRHGTWYTMSYYYYFTQNDATVVCRQLGYLTTGAHYFFSHYSHGYGSALMFYYYNIRCRGDETSLSQCPLQSDTNMFGHYYDIGVSCNTGITATPSVRLVGGSSEYEGRLQVFYDGVWSTVCDSYWSQLNTDVACQSAFGAGVTGSFVSRNRRASLYGTQATGVILLDYIQCNGQENSILSCGHSSPASSSCSHSYDVAVQCRNDTVRLVNGSVDGWGQLQYLSDGQWSAVCAQDFNITEATVVCSQLGYPPNGSELANVSSTYSVYNQSFSCQGDEKSLSDCPTSTLDACPDNSSIFIKCQGRVRLSGGPSEHTGRLEMYRVGTWYTACSDYGFYQVSATVVCGQLGYHTSRAYYFMPAPDTQSADSLAVFQYYKIRCSGDESTLSQCPLQYTSSGCLHDRDVGVSCNTGTVRLTGRTADWWGELQYWSGGQWSAVCAQDWDTEDTTVVCTQLGFTSNGSESTSHYIASSSVSVHNQSFVCEGDERSLSDCRTSTLDNCSDSSVVSVRCQVSLRIADGPRPSAGRLEILRDGFWYSVCSDGFDQQDTSVVCRQLGYPLTGARYWRSNFEFNQGSRAMYYSRFDCGGSENTVSHCSQSPVSCSNNYGITVVCNPGDDLPQRVRLLGQANTTEGILQVNYNGVWGTVCNHDWDDIDSEVACRQIFGSKYYGTQISESQFTRQSGIVWLAHVDCLGNENSLLDCPNSNHYCSHNQDVALSCKPVIDGCRETFTARSGTFTSPGYPSLYRSEPDCLWIINATQYNETITISFLDLNTAESQCTTNYIHILDSEDGAVIASYCGSGIPDPLTSSGSILYIRLISTSDAIGNRFSASWSTACEESLTAEEGMVQSPGYPNTYPANQTCIYIINRPAGEVIRLNFTAFHMDGDGQQCGSDYVEIRDGGSEYSPILGKRYCGSELPPLVTSTQNLLWLKFHTDDITDVQSVGFSARYTSGPPACSKANLTDITGTFSSPGYPRPYPSHTECVWTITAPQGMLIALQFPHFNVYGWGSTCLEHYVTVYDVHKGQLTEITTLCGTKTKTDIGTLSSTSNQMVVLFKSAFYYSYYYSYYGFNGFQATYEASDPSNDASAQNDAYPYGPDKGDTSLPIQNDATVEVPIDTGVYIGTGLQYSAYVSTNGLVTFGASYTWPELIPDKMMLLPFASYIDVTNTSGGVYHQLYDGGRSSDRVVLDKASTEVRLFTDTSDFSASVALIVTWDHVKQRTVPSTQVEEATFQTVIVSDGRSTYSLIYHLAGAMNWPQRTEWPYVIIGASDGGNSVKTSLNSGTEQVYTSDKQKGNTGKKGTWLFKLGEGEPNPDQQCMDWYNRNKELNGERSAGFVRLPRCPCSLRAVWRRTRFTWRWSRYQKSGQIECYRLTRTASRRLHPYSKECCYGSDVRNWATYNQLIMEAPYAGSALAYNPAYWALRENHQRDDRDGHDACCIRSSKVTYCKLFYKLRPIGQCRANIPFRFSWMFGDPHITTLDGTSYTFNGWGEYTMIAINTQALNFTLQGRTDLAETESGTLTNATVFTAFGAEENGMQVFVQLDPNTKDSLIIYVGETDYSVDFLKEDFDVEEDDFTLSKDNHSLVVAFPSEISLTITIGMKSLDISVAMPLTYQNQTRGLLGNFNGMQGDDFILPNGTVLGSNLTERQIFEMFGNQWSVTRAVSSVLRYGPREGPADYDHPHFTPIYLDEQPAATRQAAEEVCGGSANLACIFDFIATGSAAFADASRQTKDTADTEVEQGRNSLPKLEVPTNVSVTSDEPITLAVTALDDDNDTVTYKLVDDNGGRYSINSVTGVINATFSAVNSSSLSVYAVDSKGAVSPTMVIRVRLCSGCSGHGSCDFSQAIVSPQDPNIEFAVCLCEPAYSGQNCESELDACKDSPCQPEQTCTDLTAEEQGDSEVGYNCTGCPGGFHLHSSVCVDIDECSNNTLNDCSQRCENTGGSYICKCDPGYRLGSDGRTCRDVNECVEKSDQCMQLCQNTDGSFHCLCQDGYSLAEDGRGCLLNATSSTVCVSAGCSQGCSPSTDPNSGNTVAQCFCYSGFQLDADRANCSDIDECQQGRCSQSCENTDGGFMCSCHRGYKLGEDKRTCTECTGLTFGLDCSLTCSCNGHGADCDPVSGCVCEVGWSGEHCEEDVDECAENPDVCGKEQVCSNTNGSFSCSCLPGYAKDAGGICSDIDECLEANLAHACGELEQCSNIPGSYYCTCISGYKRIDGACTDINECSNGGDDCQQKCVNVQGSYSCDCFYGYRLKPDRRTCTQVADICSEFENLNCDQGCTLGDDDKASCFCDTGYSLASDNQTCVDIDECSGGLANCSHTCNNTAGGFLCSCPIGMVLDNDRQTCLACPAGTYGKNCDRTCSCGQGSDRCDVITGCVCLSGWNGVKCDRDINECDTTAVQEECRAKNAECVNHKGGYSCRCQQGYVEDDNGTCQDQDECATSPCSQQCENSPGSFRCLCDTGFTLATDGLRCQDIDECALQASNPCTQRCENTAGSFRCVCDVSGYTQADDGVSCIATTNCSNTVCDTDNGGCSIENSTETCFCNAGYTLSDNNTTCTFIDVDWCGKGPCQQMCNETDDGKSFTCSCREGFLLNQDQQTCRACPEGTYGAECSQNCMCNTLNTASCNSTTGACVCKAGWEGETCSDDVDECNTSPGSLTVCPDHSVCTNTNGSFLCLCLKGFYKSQSLCLDIDECGEDTDGCEQRCVNEPGTFRCDCDPGYTLRSDNKTCADIDECKDQNGGCGHNCSNTVGSYRCSCLSGYTLNTTDNASCDDVDECRDQNGGCGHNCSNTVGSYRCSCQSGYTLNTTDNMACDDIDECMDQNGGCGYNCSNTVGSYHCSCLSGYTLNTTDNMCEDIDECMDQNGGCGHNCSNTVGSYRCSCLSGYTLNTTDNATCDDVDECMDQNGGCGHNCSNTVGSYRCSCLSGYTLNTTDNSCKDIDECVEDADGCEQRCVNEPGTFHCDCDSGYSLRSDDKTCAETKSFRFGVTIEVDVQFNESDKESALYLSLVAQIKRELTAALVNREKGIVDIKILAIRMGSIEVDAEAVTVKDTAEDVESLLSRSLLDLSKRELTIGGKTGSSTVHVNGSTLTGDSRPCDVLMALGTCDRATEVCEESEGRPFCRKARIPGSESWKLIVGVSTGVPLVAIIAGFIACCVLAHRRRGSKNETSPTTRRTGPADDEHFPPALYGWMNRPKPSGIQRPKFYDNGVDLY